MSWKLTNEYQQKAFKHDAVRIASALNKAKIDCTLEHEVVRYGEFKNGHPLSYVLDILLIDPRYQSVAIEVEGEGSSSKDNDKRDAYLSTLGIRVLHVDNKIKGEEVIVRLNGSFRR
jgi:very-short-patch-repair endonuclease